MVKIEMGRCKLEELEELTESLKRNLVLFLGCAFCAFLGFFCAKKNVNLLFCIGGLSIGCFFIDVRNYIMYRHRYFKYYHGKGEGDGNDK